MKQHITRNDLHGVKIAVPACALHNALMFFENDLIGYACGVYGWNYDAYRIGGVNLLTGYRCEGRRAKIADVKEIEETARRLIEAGALYDDGERYNARAILRPMIEAL